MYVIILLRHTLLVVLSTLLGVFLCFCLYLYRMHRRYDHLPGPKRSSFFLGNVSEIRSAYRRGIHLEERMAELQQEYGPVFVMFIIHRVTVLAADPKTVKDLLMNKIHVKSKMYEMLHDLYGVRFAGKGLLTVRDNHKWNIHRKVINPAFHRKRLMNLMKHFNASADKLVLKLKQDADTGKAVPLMDGINRTTLDIVAKTAFGLKAELILEDNPFHAAIDATFNGLHYKIRTPLAWIFPSHWKYRREVQKAAQYVRDTAEELISKGRKAYQDGEDIPENILSILIKLIDSCEDKVDMKSIVDEVVTFLMAGNETTSGMLGFAVTEIGKRPEIMQRVQGEIDGIVGDRDFVTYEDVMKMDYTLRVLKETLRLYPPVAGTSRVIAHDITACGHRIPTGSTVQLNHFVMSRMEEFFENALTFDPDRFLRNQDNGEGFFIALGDETKLGEPMIEARVILAKLYQNFDLMLDPTQDFGIFDRLTLRPKGRCMNFIYNRQ